MLGSRSRPQKARITALNPKKLWAANSAHWSGQWRLKKTKNWLKSWPHGPKTPNPKLKMFVLF